MNGDDQTPSKFLLGAFGILTAALTAFAAVSGTIDRIERNHPVLFWAGAVTVLVAVSVGVFAQSRARTPPCSSLRYSPRTRRA